MKGKLCCFTGVRNQNFTLVSPASNLGKVLRKHHSYSTIAIHIPKTFLKVFSTRISYSLFVFLANSIFSLHLNLFRFTALIIEWLDSTNFSIIVSLSRSPYNNYRVSTRRRQTKQRHTKNKTNFMAFSPQWNNTDWATATCPNFSAYLCG
jgi:hypothetical protein